MHVRNNRKFQVLLVKPNSLLIPCTLLNTPYMYACFCGSIIQCVVKQPMFAPCHLLFYLTDVADDMKNMPCTLTKIDTMIVFALHLCLLCWHGNPVVWWSSPHYEQCQIMLLIFWTYSLFSNLKLDRIDRTVIIFVYTRANLSSLCFVSGWYAWWHAQVCWRLWDKPNIYCSKEGKTSWR